MLNWWWEHDAEPWQFWFPGSGLPGGMVCGLIFDIVFFIVFFRGET